MSASSWWRGEFLLLLLNVDGEDGLLHTNDTNGIPVITLRRQVPDGKFNLITFGLLSSYEAHPQGNLIWP